MVNLQLRVISIGFLMRLWVSLILWHAGVLEKKGELT